MTGSFAVVLCPNVPYPPQTGGQKRTLRLLEAIDRAGVRPHVLTPDPLAAEHRSALEARGWRVDLVFEPDPSLLDRARQQLAQRPSPYLRRVAARMRELVRERPAWVQLEHGWSAYYLRQLADVRSVWSLHNLDSEMLRTSAAAMRAGGGRVRAELRWRAMRATEIRYAPLADRVVCVSKQERSELERLGARAMLVPNGVDAELLEVPPPDPDSEVVLFFGQLRYEPNRRGLRHFLARGWPLVSRARPRASLRVIGEGAGEELRRAIERAERAELVGLVPDLGPELARAAVVVVPVWEGAGTRLKVLESMAAGRPVAGTSLGVGGTGFEDGVHGRVADDPAGLAQGLVELLESPALRAAAGHAGRELAARSRWELVLAPLESLYREWVAAAPKRSLGAPQGAG